ncbi:Gfo/Idh/MocA family protein [Psychroflexus sediminis]|uniref:Predicted dehydrogenase n=1 Tax=Psychroflexus sediminis TaxID=470826 RepID=A0A1G7U0E1_9FLAO|nr:Gfo/Idh/MocA family oxidoreductase [Psychroflexus sediminis]SDG40897.1 Predicted dehydrogenase [Psychroflexus sediminis]
MNKTHNWGIIGLGGIAQKFASDLQDIKTARLYAVASRTLEKAQEFSSKFKVENAYGSYEDLAKDPEVDIIYVATPHVFHYENTLMCLEHGKAVLCEKPMAMNARQLKAMIELSKKKSLFLMEGLWTNFMPHLQKVHQLAQNETYGKCLKVEADFSFKAEFDTGKRLFNKDLGGGALLDIGIYPVYLALKLLGVPQLMEAASEFSSTGVDVSNQIKFNYSSGATAHLSSSFAKTTASRARVHFENATVEFGSRFHETDQLEIRTNSGVDKLDFNYPTHGYQFEIEHVQDCLEKGLTQSPEWSLQASLELAETLDKIREIMGLVYKEDKSLG